MSGGRVLVAFSMRKRQNSRTDGRTPTYISQRWTNMATRAMELGERCYNWSSYYSSSVRKKEDSGGTSPARAYATKKTTSPGLMLASNAAPLFTLHVRPGACHPICRRRLAREPVILNYEGGSSAAMAVDGGRRSWRKTSAKDEGDGRKRQENGSMDSYAWFHPLFILPSKRQPIGHGASCPHHALRIPRRWQVGPGPARQSVLYGKKVVQRC
jgi:hypothetical protein